MSSISIIGEKSIHHEPFYPIPYTSPDKLNVLSEKWLTLYSTQAPLDALEM